METNCGFDPDVLLRTARQRSGFDDYGDPRFREGLEQYCSALNTEARLNEVGRDLVASDITDLLVNRLRVHHDLEHHPEIGEEQIAAPLIITGLPRTGTTKLHQVIAQDPDILKLPYWMAINPARFPHCAGSADEDPRITVAEERLRLTATHTPEVLSAHPSQLHDPEEESLPMRLTFETPPTAMFDYVPSYLSWLTEQPREPSYRYLRTLLGYWQWQFGGGEGRAWVLKTPDHLAALESITDVFPGALIVHCHRDPVDMVPSMLRLMEVVAGARGNRFSSEELRDLYVPYWADRVDENRRQRDALGSRLRLIDVQYERIVDDCPGVIDSIYQAWGHELSPEAGRAMSEWEMRHPQHRHGRNVYSLDRYGLTAQSVLAAFKASMA